MELTSQQALAIFLAIAALAEAYLIGAIPWSLIVGLRFYDIDLRTEGSGNLGATNVVPSARAQGSRRGSRTRYRQGRRGRCARMVARAGDAIPGTARLGARGRGSCGDARAFVLALHQASRWQEHRRRRGRAPHPDAEDVPDPAPDLHRRGRDHTSRLARLDRGCAGVSGSRAVALRGRDGHRRLLVRWRRSRLLASPLQHGPPCSRTRA